MNIINRKAKIVIASIFWGIEIFAYSYTIIAFVIMLSFHEPAGKHWNNAGFIVIPLTFFPSLISGIATAMYSSNKIKDFWDTAFFSSLAILFSAIVSYIVLVPIRNVKIENDFIFIFLFFLSPVVIPILLMIAVWKLTGKKPATK